MAKHALLSASGAHRWLECTPSALLELQFPQNTSEYAEEGTAAHELCELTARYFLGEVSEMDFENRRAELAKGPYYNAEMQECANDYARFVTEKTKAAQESCEDAFTELEVRVDFSKYVKDGFGTGDCIIVADKVLEIVDFKYGKGVRVEATGNPQMKLYALGALLKYNTLFDIDSVRMTIFQPRLSGVQSSDEITVKELLEWAEKYVKPRAKLAYKGEGEFAPSEEVCKFCRAKAQCKARADKNLKLFDEAPDATENKGIDFALNRLSCHLQRHYRKYGREGYVLLFDFSNYFANAQHWPVSRELAKRVHDVRIRALANECLDNFGPIGYGLGSQISQTAALMLPNKLDHFIKEKLGIKGYARYMDDGYLIHPSKEYLKECLTRMKEVCDSLGIILNTKKTKIKKLSEGFKFLQIRFKLTETGKVLRKMSFESIKKIRRKLKKFKLWNIEGRVVKIAGKFVRRVFPLSDICSAYESWRGHMKRGNSFHAVERMDLYFKKLFGFHPNNKIEWRKALCT